MLNTKNVSVEKINESTTDKLKLVRLSLEYCKSKKVFLKSTDILRVSRYISGELGDRDFSHMSVAEAIKNTQWDKCRGTMSFSINMATDKDFSNPHTIFGSDVLFDGRRAYINIYKSLPTECFENDD